MSLRPFVRPDEEDWSTHAAEMARHEALLRRIAAQVSLYDGSRPGGLLLGPRLLLLAALDRLPDERLLRLGTAIEMIRRATLVHRDPKRECRWEGYGDATLSQTLRGDVLLAESFRLLACDDEPRAVLILSRAMAGVSAGELERHTADEGDGATNRQAAFTEGAAETGALVSGMGPRESERFIAWARTVGECHERALAGALLPATDRARLRAAALPAFGGFVDELIARLGSPDVQFRS